MLYRFGTPLWDRFAIYVNVLLMDILVPCTMQCTTEQLTAGNNLNQLWTVVRQLQRHPEKTTHTTSTSCEM